MNQFILTGRIITFTTIKYCNKEMIQINLKVENSTYKIIIPITYENMIDMNDFIAVKGHLETNDTDIFLISDRLTIILKG